MLLNVSATHLFWQGRDPQPIEPLHRPTFLAFPQDPREPVAAARERLARLVAQAAGEDVERNALAKVHEVGTPLRYESFWNHGGARDVIPVQARRSYWVPDISDALFLEHGFYTCEHDIPYVERALSDLAAEQDWWLWDSKGKPASLRFLTYDIETTQFGTGARDVPIDIIGYADFGLKYEASKDLETEQFDFRFLDLPQDWKEREVTQLVANNRDEELDNLERFTKLAASYDVVAGHNLLGFDNKQIHERIKEALDRDKKQQNLSPGTRAWFERFTTVYSRPDRSFHFGTSSDTVVWYPVTFDTYHAARKFYFFHDDFTLKGLAPWLGIEVEDRVYLEPDEMKLDGTTLKYNEHDVREQLGITQILAAQALPLGFTVNLPLEELLTGGTTKMWDHMAFIRARRRRRLMPATCRAQGVARSVQRLLPGVTFPTREQIAQAVVALPPGQRAESANKEFLRVVKQGPEMPFWLEHPNVIMAADGSDHGYAIAGGLTLKPDSELHSHFVPWYHVVEADVGAMYPTILKARNLTADAVVPARIDEQPDDWLWLRRLDLSFAESGRFHARPADAQREPYTRGKGWMVGVRQRKEPGMVNLAMTGILDTIVKVKQERARARRSGAPKEQVNVLDMTYASLKAARNAGTHGILVAVNVSCRQFNVWGGATITTIGQRILQETLDDLEGRGIRVVYGDSVTGDRNVVVRDPQGLVRVLPIEELFVAAGGAAHDWHGKEAVHGAGWQALCAGGDASPAWRPIVRVIRHATDKPVVRVRQKDGETTCTQDHSVMVRRGGQVVRARPVEALEDPFVRVPVPRNEVLAEVDLLPYVEPLARSLETGAPVDGRNGRPLVRFGHDDDWIWFSNSLEERARPRRFRRRLRVGSPELSALCRLVGAYAAEGSVTWNGKRRGASIATSDTAWLAEMQSDYHRLFEGYQASVIASTDGAPRNIVLAGGEVVQYIDRTHKLQMTNMGSAVFFWALCGKGSAGKRLPDFVFNLPRPHQEEVLRALVRGDGSHGWGPRYTKEHNERHFMYTTKSLRLASGFCALLTQLGHDHSVHRRAAKGTYAIKTRGRRKDALHARLDPVPYVGYVYDLEVEEHHTFVDALGNILLHNTDGLYLGCSRSAGNLPHLAEAIGSEAEPDAKAWITLPDTALKAVEDANRKWRDELQYPGFELEAEQSDAMVFIVHKNYLKFKARGGKLAMETKGNNFKGSDKAPLARRVLEDIMRRALHDVAVWSDEEEARERMKAAIKRATRDVMSTFKVAQTPWADLVLRQGVQAVRSYQPNPDGTMSSFAVRTAALEQVIGEAITATRKFRFVVCKDPLPLYVDPKAQQEAKERLARQGFQLVVKKPKKSGIKPIEFMWPVEKVQPHHVDWAWYRELVENYVMGAFGFESLESAVQRDLSSWF